MKIAFISSLMSNWGGSEIMWYLTAKSAINSGDETYISVYDQDKLHPNILELKNTAKYFEVRTNEIKIAHSSILKRIKYKITRNTIQKKHIKKLKQFNPDKIVISLANTFDIVWQSQIKAICQEFGNKIILQSNYHDEHLILNIHDIEQASYIFNKSKAVIFASQRNRLRCEHHIANRIKDDKVIIIQAPTNYNIEELTPIELDENSPIVLCMMSRFDLGLKGHDIILEVLSNEKWMKRNWIINLYGEGDDKEYLKKIISFYNLEDRVFLMGYSNNIIEEWKKNHILLMPSIGEGTPIVLMIAMLCGRPAVVTNVAGHQELIDDNINGYVANGPDVFSIDEAMENAWLNKNNWQSMGIKGRKKALTKLNKHPEKLLYNIIQS